MTSPRAGGHESRSCYKTSPTASRASPSRLRRELRAPCEGGSTRGLADLAASSTAHRGHWSRGGHSYLDRHWAGRPFDTDGRGNFAVTRSAPSLSLQCLGDRSRHRLGYTTSPSHPGRDRGRDVGGG